MDIVAVAFIGIFVFFGIVLLTVLLGALGRKDAQEIRRRNAEDIATGGGGMTLPPTQGSGYREQPV